MSTTIFGYNNMKLIRRPHKRFPYAGETLNNNDNIEYCEYRVDEIGDFSLIPLGTGRFYNYENQVFPPFDAGQHTGESRFTGKVYVISDQDVGMMIPHIKKVENDTLYTPLYNNVDLDKVSNHKSLESYDTCNTNSIGNGASGRYDYSVDCFIFVQPVFLNENSLWYVFIPRYKINDNNVHFDRFQLNNFNSIFERDSEDVMNQAVISNKKLEDMNFSQIGIGKNGISMVNGLKYIVDDGGNARFNVGNIRSDSTAYYVSDDTREYTELRVDSSTYNKGEVLSGSSFSALLGSVLFSLGAERLYACEIATIQGNTARVINNCDFNPAKPLQKFTIFENTGGSVANTSLGVSRGTYGDNNNTNDTAYRLKDPSGTDVSSLTKGCYYDIYFDGTDFILTQNKKLPKINKLLDKISKYDILLVKK